MLKKTSAFLAVISIILALASFSFSESATTASLPPTLFLHGQKDTDVPFEQSVMMAKELERAGVEHELALYPEGFHCFDAFWEAEQFKKDAEDALGRAFQFVQKHMQLFHPHRT